MKFGESKTKSLADIRIFLILSMIIIGSWLYRHSPFYDILNDIIGLGLGFFAYFGLRLLRNRKKPFFEVKDDILIYKTYWAASIREYPLKNFKGKIETRKTLFEVSLRAPSKNNKLSTIYIGMLDKEERNLFVKYLNEKVKDISTTAQH
jgi:hypothetical protein